MAPVLLPPSSWPYLGAHRSETGESAYEAQMGKGTTHRWERGEKHVRHRAVSSIYDTRGREWRLRAWFAPLGATYFLRTRIMPMVMIAQTVKTITEKPRSPERTTKAPEVLYSS